jgi:3-deoxy-D-manno-octulosonic-acid transferase
VQINDVSELATQVDTLTRNVERRKAMSREAKEFTFQHRGTTRRLIVAIKELVKT